MNDLENMIRSALKERAGEVIADRLRRSSPTPVKRHSPKRWLVPIVTATAVALLALGLAIARPHDSDRSVRTGGPPAAGVTGYRWNLTTIAHDHATFHYTTAARRAVYLIFRPDGQIEGSDGVNFYSGVTVIRGTSGAKSGRYQLTDSGYKITGEVGQTFVAYGGTDPRVLAARSAIGAALQTDRDIDAHETDGTLTIKASGYRLTLTQGAPVGNAPTPSPTNTR